MLPHDNNNRKRPFDLFSVQITVGTDLRTLQLAPLHQMASSGDTDESSRRLLTVLTKEAGVETALADLIIVTHKLASVADLASFFIGDEYQKGVETEFLAGTVFEKNRLQAARLRTAVELCRSELGHALTSGKRSSSNMDDWDSPLDPAIRIEAEAAFKQKHHLQFDDNSKPAPALFARLFREFKRGCLSVHDLRKVRSVSDCPTDMHAEKKRRSLGGGVELTFAQEQELDHATPFASIHEFLWKLQVLSHGWAVAGLSPKPSRLGTGNVSDAEYQQCMSYVHFVQVAVMKHGGNQSQVLAWVADRDKQTRAAARQLAQEGYPFGEALQVAREQKEAILWTCSQINASSAATVVPTRVPGSAASGGPQVAKATPQVDTGFKAAKKGENTLKASECCPAFNQGGCERKQKKCPDRLKHLCSAKLAGGLCGSWQHNKSTCPNR